MMLPFFVDHNHQPRHIAEVQPCEENMEILPVCGISPAGLLLVRKEVFGIFVTCPACQIYMDMILGAD